MERIPSVEAVLFDLDGTLINTIPLIKDSWKHTIRTVLGRESTDEEYNTYIGLPLRDQMQAVGGDVKKEEMVNTYIEYSMSKHDSITAYPGVAEALRKIQDTGRFKIGIVTSKQMSTSMRGLRVCNLAHFFPEDCIIASDTVSMHKPDPLPVLECARRLSVEPSKCVMVGDAPFDILAGKRAGALTVAAKYGAFPPERLLEPRPDFVIESFNQLWTVLTGPAQEFVYSQ